MFINDLPLHVSSSIDLYADDTTVTASVDYNSIPYLQVSLNKSVNEIAQWATSNKLPLNANKTKFLLVTGKRLESEIESYPNIMLDGMPLKMVTNVSLLGLELDDKLSFDFHVDQLCKKLSRRIAVLRKIRSHLSLQQRISFYNVMIRPVINYVSVIWTTCSKENLERVFKLQKRAARTTLFADRLTPSVHLFNNLRWSSFYEEAKIRRCVLVFNGLLGTLPPYLKDLITLNNEVHSRNTRYSSSNLLCPRYKRETEGGRTFAVISCRLWNSLPLTLRKLETVKLFKHKIWGYFFNEQLILNSFSI